ncbi:putative amino acid transporter, transmembrane domain-containing protein [Rosa chinensis]|uniref:Putative amino acid transporter, transmembrane domain-containing protein n=1 Tax=Rosa chinensis TaxID=74649 RepID=A0A2P6Q8R5_ROSCH|nr:putative amino acid transporter, transmembrane domain-containing protein [Rosa chinensis]
MASIDSRTPLLTGSTGSCSFFMACFNGTSAFLASRALAEGGRAPDLGKIGGGPVRKSTVTATKGSALPLYHQFDRRSDRAIFFHGDQASVDRCLGKDVSSRDLIWLWDPGPRWWLRCFLAALSLLGMVVVWGCAHVRLTTEDMLCVVMGFGGRLAWWLTTAPFSAATSETQMRSVLMAAQRWRDWMPNRSWVSRSNLAKALGCCWVQIRIHSMGLTSPGGWIWDPGDAMMLFNSPVFFSLGMLVLLSGRLFVSTFYKESQYFHAVSTTIACLGEQCVLGWDESRFDWLTDFLHAQIADSNGLIYKSQGRDNSYIVAGWLSLVFCLLIAIMTFYTAFLLKKCMDSDPSITSYLDIAERAFDKRARTIASIFLNTEMYLVATGLIISESDNLHKLFSDFKMDFGPLVIGGRQSFVLITALIISPTMMMIDLSVLSYVSATGVFSTLVIVVSLVCVGAFGGVGFQGSGVLLNVSGIPTAVSLYIFCFAGHPVIPSIYISMRKRDQFGKVLFVIYFLTTITCMVTAVTGYLMFGNNTESQITLNLPITEFSAQITISTVLLIPVTRYALHATPVANVIEGGVLSKDGNNSRLLARLIRLGLLASKLYYGSLRFPLL